MPKSMNPKKIIAACRLHFYGDELKDIAVLMEVAPSTLTRWKKTKIWIDYEAKLIDEWHQRQQEKEKTLRTDAPTPARRNQV